MSNEAFIFDAIRTPRGRGKTIGSLHEVKPITLLVQILQALQERNGFDREYLDDIVMGCVSAVGDQRADIAKTAALAAGWNDDVDGVILNRFSASGLEAVNTAAQKVRSDFEHLIVAGGVESMSRIQISSDGCALAADPETNIFTGFMPKGIGTDLIATIDGYSLTDVDAFAAKSHRKAAAAWELDCPVITALPYPKVSCLVCQKLLEPAARRWCDPHDSPIGFAGCHALSVGRQAVKPEKDKGLGLSQDIVDTPEDMPSGVRFLPHWMPLLNRY